MLEGESLGISVGLLEGEELRDVVGLAVGPPEGVVVGLKVGDGVGLLEAEVGAELELAGRIETLSIKTL